MERVVQLVGKAEAVAAGVKEVLDLIRQVSTDTPARTLHFI